MLVERKDSFFLENFLWVNGVFKWDKPAQEVVTARKEYNLHHTNDQKWVNLENTWKKKKKCTQHRKTRQSEPMLLFLNNKNSFSNSYCSPIVLS